MTEQEIQTLCAEYSNSRPADEMPCNPGLARMIAADFFNFLSERFFVVEKKYVFYTYQSLQTQAVDPLESAAMMISLMGGMAGIASLFPDVNFENTIAILK